LLVEDCSSPDRFLTVDLKKILHKLLGRSFGESEFSRNILTLLTGSTIAQAVPILIAPILTRIYSPAEYGTLAIYVSIVALVSVVATGQYELAVVLPKEEGKAVNLMALVWWLVTIVSIVIAVLIFFFEDEIIFLIENESVRPWLMLVPLSVFLTGVYQSFNYYATRWKQFKMLASNRVVQAVVTPGVKLGFGWFGFTTNGLIAGTIVGQAMAVGLLVGRLRKYIKPDLKGIRREEMKVVAREHQDFPKVGMLQTFLDSFKESGILLVISAFFGATALGYYSFAYRILRMPLNLIGSSVTSVFYQKANEIHNDGQSIWPLTKKIILRLALAAFPILLIVVLFGPQLFGWVFGKEWSVAGEYARLLSPWIMAHFIGSPVSSVPLILQRQKTFLYIGAGYSLSVFGMFFLCGGGFDWNIDLTLGIVSGYASAYMVGVIIWIRHISIKGGKLNIA